jgi:crossover junction endodeoxyribonuclease RuvC
MIVLGVDPGLRSTGYAVLAVNNNDVTLLAGGCIVTSQGQRLKAIYEELMQVILGFEPDCAVIESTFVNINPRTSLALGQARGVCLLSLEMMNVQYTEISTTIIRKNVTGRGNATKEEVQQMIENRFGFKMSHHVTDAIASVISVFTQ